MSYDRFKHRRRSIRLKEYDYSQAGSYFITVCTRGRECLFGEITDGEMRLNAYGEIVQACWDEIPHRYPHVELNQFIIMPNHLHGIILIHDDMKSAVGAIHESPLQTTMMKRRQMLLSKIVGRFKMNSGKRINEARQIPGNPVWQRNYYEHIIRTEKELSRIQDYVINNPVQWEYDRNNLDGGSGNSDEPWSN
ncbi:MAG: transposase [Ignavibacteria bacterium]|nr:transposase [Ignavibacteria bacterium]